MKRHQVAPSMSVPRNARGPDGQDMNDNQSPHSNESVESPGENVRRDTDASRSDDRRGFSDDVEGDRNAGEEERSGDTPA